jgi:site-specific DNA-methyltransferase (adenine-specific)
VGLVQARLRTRVDGRTNPAEGKSITTTPEAYIAGQPFQLWCQQWATECLRILKPGGHLLAFGGSRTWHRISCAVEDAGFEIRDSIAWLYGSGFPKSLDVSKAIDKAAGAEREVVGAYTPPDGKLRTARPAQEVYGDRNEAWNKTVTAPTTEAAQQWQGWGTALKPAFEPIVVGRKPFPGTVAANVQEHGTAALNIDACRIAAGQDYADKCASVIGLASNRNGDAYGEWTGTREDSASPAGRWPTNVVLDESQAVDLDAQTAGTRASKPSANGSAGTGGGIYGSGRGLPRGYEPITYTDGGGASRFFPTFHYEAKAPSSERPRDGDIAHPTVKPLDLMRWLVRLVTPPGGTVLEPFAGSGTTAEACVIEGFKCIAIEREADYLPLIINRLSKPIQMGLDFEGGAA